MSLQSFFAETLVDGSLGLVAHADGGVEEAVGVAFLEGGHDFFASFGGVSGGGGNGGVGMFGTAVVFGMEMRMHDESFYFYFYFYFSTSVCVLLTFDAVWAEPVAMTSRRDLKLPSTSNSPQNPPSQRTNLCPAPCPFHL